MSQAMRLTFILLAGLTGCDRATDLQRSADVLSHFGGTGRGPAQFVYPRAITLADDGSIYVVDKTARVQHIDAKGNYITGWTMPEWDAGKPVGISCGSDGNVYVADTHYHRIMVYSPMGDLIHQFGSYGTEDGQFIFPTDVAIAPDGRIFVSEYGGNDRINIFSSTRQYMRSFGALGEADDQFSRPSAICLDSVRERLYVADSCNHRIACYDLEGKQLKLIGQIGSAPGELRYPYDVNLMPDGSIIVCEFGNNRIQRFSPGGESLGTWGKGGRELGELVYPWGAIADSQDRLFVVDSGNNRIQVWRF